MSLKTLNETFIFYNEVVLKTSIFVIQYSSEFILAAYTQTKAPRPMDRLEKSWPEIFGSNLHALRLDVCELWVWGSTNRLLSGQEGCLSSISWHFLFINSCMLVLTCWYSTFCSSENVVEFWRSDNFRSVRICFSSLNSFIALSVFLFGHDLWPMKRHLYFPCTYSAFFAFSNASLIRV